MKAALQEAKMSLSLNIDKDDLLRTETHEWRNVR